MGVLSDLTSCLGDNRHGKWDMVGDPTDRWIVTAAWRSVRGGFRLISIWTLACKCVFGEKFFRLITVRSLWAVDDTCTLS